MSVNSNTSREILWGFLAPNGLVDIKEEYKMVIDLLDISQV
jgi:hypothetical protein